MDVLAQGAHYAMHQSQQHVAVHKPLTDPHGDSHGSPSFTRSDHVQQIKRRQSPYGQTGRSSSVAAAVRRRISRACDQCNQLRTKCDGQHPCAHCIEFGLGCEYIRQHKKRGKASRKDLAQLAAAQQVKAETNGEERGTEANIIGGSTASHNLPTNSPGSGNVDDQRNSSDDQMADLAEEDVTQHGPQTRHQHNHLNSSAGGLNINDYGGALDTSYDRSQQGQTQAVAVAPAASLGDVHQHHGGQDGDMYTHYAPSQATLSTYPDVPYTSTLHTQGSTSYPANANASGVSSPAWMTMTSPQPQNRQQVQQQQQHHNQSPEMSAAHMHSLHNMQSMHSIRSTMPAALAGATVVSMGDLGALAPGLAGTLSHPIQQQQQSQQQHSHHSHIHLLPGGYKPTQLRYPVLEPLVPHLVGIVPLNLACDLIDLYFASSSSAQMHPMSPYVLGFVFRKRSFLHPTRPRACQPALLASMLWVAAQTSDASLLTSVPSARSTICQKLLELTVGLLKPLIHTSANHAGAGQRDVDKRNTGHDNPDGVDHDGGMQPTGMDVPVFDGVSLGGLGVAMPGTISMEDALAHVAAVESMNMYNAPAVATNKTVNINGSGNAMGGAFGAAGTIDDVATYIHLATVVSASEYKGASLRWWNAAWSLARELRLGRELPLYGTSSSGQNAETAEEQAQAFHQGQMQPKDTCQAHLQNGDEKANVSHGLMGMSNMAGMSSVRIDDLAMNGMSALGREVGHDDTAISTSAAVAPGQVISDEEREERRRIWWLVYIVDRHLALCYNRPLYLLDVECTGLLRPMDDTDWQNGDFKEVMPTTGAGVNSNSNVSNSIDTSGTTIAPNADATYANHTGLRRVGLRGPTFECSGHSIFGYFLPLMTILGEIVDLHHARNHPLFGHGFRTSQEWDAQVAEITRHLAIYELSLQAFEHRTLSPAALAAANEDNAAAAMAAADASNAAADANGNTTTSSLKLAVRAASVPHDGGTPLGHGVHSVNHSVHSTPTSSSAVPAAIITPGAAPLARMTELDIQTRIVAAYGNHVMHVLHILLAGKWDPVNLLDDNDLWISTQGFITATGHAVSAAEAISSILEYDPGLEFMPFFFGIYLLQGSFLLLLIADKLQLEASTSVARACETIIRAHEACVVTLNTEYQRNFSRVMRSALAQVRGRVPEDLGEQHMRRRELLSLYRWTGDGTGLAL
ncbi:hypothetical protein SEPCBS57363_005343 [Sporothrix epigloea]|uniref:Zn(2)-C6 fungal-type domain-containing protein n=1 Tax=Sporothrix epigloea TaxID=1892477 RepID=A0ABP0DWZ2_9PEZI